MLNDEEIVIRINKLYPSIKVDEIMDGIVKTKEISQDDLLACFNNSTEKTMYTGLLPKGCICYAETENKNVTVVFESDIAKTNMTYANITYTDFPLPRLVFKVSYSKGLRVQSVYVGVLGKGKISPKLPMFYYPFSNVNTESGAICIGSNVLPNCKSAHTLESIPHLVMEYPNSDHHFTHKCNQKDFGFRELLEYMKDKSPEVYYSEILKPSKKTLSDF